MNEIGKVYDKYYSYDISMTHREADSAVINGISQIDGVKSTIGTYEMNLVELANPSFYLNTVYGIENGEFFEYIRAEQTEEAVKAINELGNGRNAIITNLMKSKLGIKKGDKITIDFKHSKQEYTVTGFVESSFKIGNIIFIPSSYMKQDAGLKYFTNVYIKTDKDAGTVTNEIKRKYLKNVLLIQTTKELVDMNQGQLDSIFNVIKSFSVLAMLIGIIGIINNLIISFIERKRYLAIYRSIGMSKKTQRKMILIESFTIGVLGVGFGIISACAMLNVVPNIVQFILGSFDINYSIPIFVLVAMISVAIMVVVSSIPARKSSQMSIIESIKYE
ncbi:MAG: ABC transporter permease YtrF precursor [Firmicutes bacterium ADurb.Bin419]|nr:MAG: ABC transporter permease YtrF precursor [Firmicutes bacterium ADurb.Bin419]